MTALPVVSPATPGPTGVMPALPAGAFTSLYVHVPFCAHKCHYCDFYSITRQTHGRMSAFVDRVLLEADAWADAAAAYETVFFGGGTPSLLPPPEMARLLDGLAERLDLTAVREWTAEVNPNHADARMFDTLAAGGVNRVSLGVQSFDSGELGVLERDHAPGDAARALDAARRAGITRHSVDLIFAIPGQSCASFAATLEAAVALNVTHMSCYGLTYESNTPLAVRRRLGRVNAAPEVVEVAMFRHARERLAAAGMPAYEISNFAHPGDECRHNLAYWRGENYLGLGPSAASHLQGVRWRNPPHLGRWEAAVDAGACAAIDVERLDRRERAGELAWLNLRTTAGIDTADFLRRTGMTPHDAFGTTLAELADVGLLDVTPEGVRLTEAGLVVADAVAAELMAS